MTDRETLDVYNASARDYEKMAGPDPYPNLRAFMAALPAGAHVLDLGCGPGLDAGHMAAAGFTVEAVDASQAMVALAAARPGVTARQASFDEGIAGEALYDGIWASFSLLHAPRAALPRHLAAIARALKPDGLFGIIMKLGEGERRDRLGRFYSYYTAEELRALIVEAGLREASVATGRGSGLDGTSSDWICVTAHA